MSKSDCPITGKRCESTCMWNINGKCAVLYIADAVDVIEDTLKSK